MTDKQLKSLLSFLFQHKADILSLLEYFQAEDLEKGMLKIPDYLINNELKDKLLSIKEVSPYLKDFTVLFQSDCVLLDIRAHLKQLGPVAAKYMFTIKEFNFSSENRRIYATFQEDITPLGNKLQSIALKTALSGNSALQTAVKLTNCPFIFVDQHKLMVDLSKVDVASKLSDFLRLEYIGCSDGSLKLNFYYVGGEKE